MMKSLQMKLIKIRKKTAEINKVDCFGVVAEFNPFHEGHSYLINKAKEVTGCECCIAAMSGDFVQRGEPAIFDKWKRAEEAVKNGVDLVVEIPQVFASQSAPFFAKGGVGVLAGLGVCDYLAFGSECGSIDDLMMLSGFISEHEERINDLTSSFMKEGIVYPKAREKAISMLPGGESITPPGPNDILATEYLRQDLGGMTPAAIKRTGAGHNETATALREKIRSCDPERYKAEDERFFRLAQYRALCTDPDELEMISGSGGGLGHKLSKEIRYASDLEDLIERIKSKIYTRTRISRLLVNLILGIRTTDVTAPGYIHILAMNDIGSRALKTVRKNGSSSLPVISNINKDTEELSDFQKDMISFDILAGDVYNIIKDHNLYDHSEFVKSPYKA